MAIQAAQVRRVLRRSGAGIAALVGVLLSALSAFTLAARPASAAPIIPFHTVYLSSSGFLHNDQFNFATNTWTDQVVPASVKAKSAPAVAQGLDGTHVVYLGTDGRVHNDRFDFKTGTWFDQIPPGSVPAKGAPAAIASTDAPSGGFHIVYLGQDGFVHNDGFNFATHAWFDQIPPGSVPAQGNPSVANFFNTTDDTMQIVYLGQDGFVHNDGFNFTTGIWFDQIPPGSVAAQGNPSAAMWFNEIFHIVYLGQDGFVHNASYDPHTGTWFDQIPPGSVAAHGSPTIAIFNIATGDTFHVLYVGKDGFVHNDGYDPTTGTWFDQIPPGSVKALGAPAATVAGDNTPHIVYTSRTGFVHDDRFDPATTTWFDQIPPGSTKTHTSPAAANF